MKRSMYEIFNTNVWIGDVREGSFAVAYRVGNEIHLLQGLSDCYHDCKAMLSQFISPDQYKIRFIRTLRAVWDINKDNYLFPKCWGCLNGDKSNNYCGGDEKGVYCSESWILNRDITYISWQSFRYIFDLNPSPLSDDEKYLCIPKYDLKDFDVLSVDNEVRFVCYLTKVSKPKDCNISFKI